MVVNLCPDLIERNHSGLINLQKRYAVKRIEKKEQCRTPKSGDAGIIAVRQRVNDKQKGSLIMSQGTFLLNSCT